MICYKCGKEKVLIMAIKVGSGPICSDCWYVDDPIDVRNAQGLSRWLRLRRAALAGHVLPDPRNQEQRDLGIELIWRFRVSRNEGARQ